MTPTKMLLTATIALLTGTQALADSFRIVTPGRGERGVAPVRPNPPRYPGDGYRPDPVRPDRPGRPPGPIYPGPGPVPAPSYIQKVIYVNRYVVNAPIYLQNLSDLYYSAQGYRLESVTVEATQIGYGAILQLLVNGYVESADYTVYGVSTLYPNYARTFGYDLSTLAVQVYGSAYINRIIVNSILN